MANRILYNELRESNPDLANDFDAIYRESLKIWEEQYLRQFTVHGKSHIEQDERNLDALTRPIKVTGPHLTAEEIFVLLSACCLHDIGMQLVDDPDARAKHAQYAYNLILYSHAQVGPEERRITLPINDNNTRHAIARIARAHWAEFALELPTEDFIVGNERGRLRLLGVLLAMADLLDISPVRARYYRSIHRLYDLDPMSELHQKMHDLVKGFQILAPNPAIRGDLQFRLEWRDNNELVRDLSDWVMKWFNSHWRHLGPVLYLESAGVIRWMQPWATIIFNPPEGPVPMLSEKAFNILHAERAEQARIDRDDFINRFRMAIDTNETVLFLFPRDSALDGHALSEWCEARARLQENCLVARMDVRPNDPLDLASIISQVMEQWGQHLPICTNEVALEHLRSYVLTNQSKAFVTIIISEAYKEELLKDLLEALLQQPEIGNCLARMCLLLTPGAIGPQALNNASVIMFDGTPLSQANVENHLKARWGFNEVESQDVYQKICALGLDQKPGVIYDYLETHYYEPFSHDT